MQPAGLAFASQGNSLAVNMAAQGPIGPAGADGAGVIQCLKTNSEIFVVLAGRPVMVNDANSFRLAKGDTLANQCVGVVATNCNAGANAEVILTGLISQADWTGVTGTIDLTPGDEYFLSTAVSGILTNIPPDTAGIGICQRIGVSIDSRQMFVSIESPTVL
jgi:hypothetical protein